MNLGIDGEQVVVFGASRGIGRAICDAFHAEGCDVVAVDIVEPDAAFPEERMTFVSGDVTHFEKVREIAVAHPNATHVVFSVGVGSGEFGFPFWNLEPAQWERVLKVNVLGAANVAHAFGPRLAARRRGTLLFLASVAGQMGSQTDPPYSAAKAAIINFMQCAAKDLAPYGVRANALSPGMVKTELNRSVWEASQRASGNTTQQSYEAWAEDKIRRVSPLGRWQTPEECAAVAVFLASTRAINITGQTINVDGGQVMHA